MNKLFGILVTLVIMSIGISNDVLSSTGSTKDKYCIFYGEIETKGCSDLGTKYFIYNISNKKSTEIKNIYFKNGFNGMPIPSFDLNCFVFFTKKEQNQYLNVLDMNKDKVEKKINVPVLSGDLVFSNNMQCMTFCRYDIEGEDKREIYFYNNRSDKLIRVTNNDLHDYDPVFSPDADFILYLSEPSLNKTILKKYSISKATTEDVKIFNGTGYGLTQWTKNGLVLMIDHNKLTPFWLDLKTGQTKDINLERIYFIKVSPDGKMFMYHQARKDDDSKWDLFVSDIDGKNPRMISKKDNVDIFGVEWVLAVGVKN